jgi:hypothetical protein
MTTDLRDLAALDELFLNIKRYRSPDECRKLMQFILRLPSYSPFNCVLLHIQDPGITHVASRRKWLDVFGRKVNPGARPYVILTPGGPVMFLYDVTETEGPDELPMSVTAPFQTTGYEPVKELQMTCENLARDRIAWGLADKAPAWAGQAALATKGVYVSYRQAQLPAWAHITLNNRMDVGPRYATLAHELGHVYCGHLGTPDDRWWTGRTDLKPDLKEFEAEMVSYIACRRLGVSSPSEAYLHGYWDGGRDMPPISLDIVLKAAGWVEAMGRRRLRARGKYQV